MNTLGKHHVTWGIITKPNKKSVDRGGKHDYWSAVGKVFPPHFGWHVLTFKTRAEARTHLKENRGNMTIWGYRHAKIAKIKVTVMGVL